jgi:hypothetical protein
MSDTTASPSPIVALTVVDGRTLTDGAITASSKVLVVARDPAANPTHPNVVSVPTMRIPPLDHEAIVGSARFAGSDETGHTTYFSGGAVDSRIHNGHSVVVHATEALLARKLGMADALESGQLQFQAALRACVDGAAVYDNLAPPDDVYEPVAMLGILVVVTQGSSRVPKSTMSYTTIRWPSVDDFLRGVESRDPAAMGRQFDPIELCVHGVCLKAAQATLLRAVDQPPFTPEDFDEAVDELVLRPASLVDAPVATSP